MAIPSNPQRLQAQLEDVGFVCYFDRNRVGVVVTHDFLGLGSSTGGFGYCTGGLYC